MFYHPTDDMHDNSLQEVQYLHVDTLTSIETPIHTHNKCMGIYAIAVFKCSTGCPRKAKRSIFVTLKVENIA